MRLPICSSFSMLPAQLASLQSKCWRDLPVHLTGQNYLSKVECVIIVLGGLMFWGDVFWGTLKNNLSVWERWYKWVQTLLEIKLTSLNILLSPCPAKIWTPYALFRFILYKDMWLRGCLSPSFFPPQLQRCPWRQISQGLSWGWSRVEGHQTVRMNT